ncbi:hypothetical protein EG329_002553 [Mollisiaceae sp. DMI_Dod_QoI]|nr:hypothetical protein EG329_002553 [Helotiales sp. DMI_Dod_QoI]
MERRKLQDRFLPPPSIPQTPEEASADLAWAAFDVIRGQDSIPQAAPAKSTKSTKSAKRRAESDTIPLAATGVRNTEGNLSAQIDPESELVMELEESCDKLENDKMSAVGSVLNSASSKTNYSAKRLSESASTPIRYASRTTPYEVVTMQPSRKAQKIDQVKSLEPELTTGKRTAMEAADDSTHCEEGLLNAPECSKERKPPISIARMGIKHRISSIAAPSSQDDLFRSLQPAPARASKGNSLWKDLSAGPGPSPVPMVHSSRNRRPRQPKSALHVQVSPPTSNILPQREEATGTLTAEDDESFDHECTEGDILNCPAAPAATHAPSSSDYDTASNKSDMHSFVGSNRNAEYNLAPDERSDSKNFSFGLSQSIDFPRVQSGTNTTFNNFTSASFWSESQPLVAPEIMPQLFAKDYEKTKPDCASTNGDIPDPTPLNATVNSISDEHSATIDKPKDLPVALFLGNDNAEFEKCLEPSLRTPINRPEGFTFEMLITSTPVTALPTFNSKSSGNMLHDFGSEGRSDVGLQKLFQFEPTKLFAVPETQADNHATANGPFAPAQFSFELHSIFGSQSSTLPMSTTHDNEHTMTDQQQNSNTFEQEIEGLSSGMAGLSVPEDTSVDAGDIKQDEEMMTVQSTSNEEQMGGQLPHLEQHAMQDRDLEKQIQEARDTISRLESQATEKNELLAKAKLSQEVSNKRIEVLELENQKLKEKNKSLTNSTADHLKELLGEDSDEEDEDGTVQALEAKSGD